jgi:hypothetical protein
MGTNTRKCIFCEGTRLTKEHIWPDWLKDYIPKRFKQTAHATNLSSTVLAPDTLQPLSAHINHQIKKGVLQRPGDPHSRRLRIVCATCNNGWMSRLQQKAKQHLVPLIADDWSQLSMHTSDILAAWATMYTMVVEFADENTLATENAERIWLRDKGEPPPTWRIFIGRHKGTKWHGVFNHFGFDRLQEQTQDPDHGEQTIIQDTGMRSQCTSFAIGGVFFKTFSTRVTERVLDPVEFARKHGLRVIWPETGGLLSKPERILDDYGADGVSRSLMPAEMQPHIRHAWEVPESFTRGHGTRSTDKS